MLSSPFVLGLRKHGVRSTPQDIPALSRFRLAGRRRKPSRDSDPTSTSTGTSGFGAYALSGESVDVVVGVAVFGVLVSLITFGLDDTPEKAKKVFDQDDSCKVVPESTGHLNGA